MTIYSPFYPGTAFDGVAGSTLPATRNVNLGDWTAIANGTVLSVGDIVQYLGSSFMVNLQHTKNVGTAAPPSNSNYTLLASSGADGQTLYTWFAYADSADGTTNFTTGAGGTRTYIGVANNQTTAVESSNPGDYTWTKIQGPAGPTIQLSADDVSFHYVDGFPINTSQIITLTATLQNTSETVNWSTSPSVTLTAIDATHKSLSLTNFGINTRVVITATGATSGASSSVTLMRDDVTGSADSILADSDFYWSDTFGGTRPWDVTGGFSRILL